ncbi:MAG TPA: helix-turn-helix domain-containing protein [Candidatus Butyricicoccus avistercoris]|uniref:Helix-turn-helix domain-containing protein n=1 Tax=Candidatus Butyricicoccus avistercoris TaxID=2838518 RepID=A0A9D1PKA4_9FIRM|nr:helix-turn-helix domain-containing protein [Candidatus Butyricicoccus avistercoris]
MEFHQELKEARNKLNMKQSEVAKALGIDTSTYCGYETGKRSPDVLKIKRLSQILQVSADKLLDIKKEDISETIKVPETTSTEELLENFILSLKIINNGSDLNDDDYAVISSVVKILDTWFTKKRQEHS